MEDDANSVWLQTSCGLVRIARSELDSWAAAVDRDKEKDAARFVQTTLFDSSDGVRNVYSVSSYNPHVAKSSDGKLWYAGPDGVSVVDPRHLPSNKLPPPVQIEQVLADRKRYDSTSDSTGRLTLPARIRDLEIEYTALSLVEPEKVLFRYKLENHDRTWQDVGSRRQAFYNDLPPGSYRFRVMASNNSGVWNETGTFLDFSIAPAYYQTTWFSLFVVAGILALLAALYHYRMQQISHRFNIRMEERVNERTRIARDFHDTLLQSFQGVLLKFHATTYLLPERPSEAKKTLEAAIEQARAAIIEGRDAVQGLRSSAEGTQDIAAAINTLCQSLAADRSGLHCPEFRVHVEGKPRNLTPPLPDEVYQIASEAVRNAFRHADAKRIEVEIRYDWRELRLRVRDDGKGIDPKVLDGDTPSGHFGLAGMHERCKLIGGNLAVWSELDSGTEAELTIPARVAYTKRPPGAAG